MPAFWAAPCGRTWRIAGGPRDSVGRTPEKRRKRRRRRRGDDADPTAWF
jgi:hypothetical protein